VEPLCERAPDNHPGGIEAPSHVGAPMLLTGFWAGQLPQNTSFEAESRGSLTRYLRITTGRFPPAAQGSLPAAG